jgi:hypothetical protein
MSIDSRQDWVPASQDIISDLPSLLYVVYWKTKYHFKINYLGPLISITVVLLSGIELFGPFTHLSDEIEKVVPATWFLYVPETVVHLWHWRGFHLLLALVLFIAAVLMVLHHRFLEKQSERYRELITFMLFTAKTIRDSSEQQLTQGRAAVLLLDNLITALNEYENRPSKLNASILVRKNGSDEPFRIYAQDSSNAFDPTLIIPRDNTVAGRVVKYERNEKPGILVYVPRTKFVHGIVFRGGDVFFSETAICTTPYQVLDEATEKDVLKCLLCVQIPLKKPVTQSVGQRKHVRRESYPIAVLSLSGQAADCMDSFHYIGARLAADLCAQLLITQD